MRHRPLAALVFALFTASCTRDAVPTAPGQPSSPQPGAAPGRLLPESAPIDTEVPGIVLTLRVRVTDSSYRIPIGGVRVNLAITGGGAIDSQAVVTDATGYARLGSWTLGAAPGTNTLVASVAGLPPVTFTVIGRIPDTVAIYDLLSVEGGQVPIPGGQGAASYVLFDDGHCTFSSIYDGTETASYCRFVASPTSIAFYWTLPGPGMPYVLFAAGTLDGPYMTVTYYLGDPTEVYLRRSNSSAMRWSSAGRH